MSLKRYDGTAWKEIENLKRHDGTAWKDVEFVRRRNGDQWVECWTRINPKKVWEAAELLYGVSRNKSATGYISFHQNNLMNPCYVFCFCGTSMSIYKWNGSSLNRLYYNNSNYPIFLTKPIDSYYHYLTKLEGGLSYNSLYGGAIAIFSFPGFQTEKLDEMFAGTVVKAISGNNEAADSEGIVKNPSINSGNFSDGDIVISSMRGIGGTYATDNFNLSVNQRTSANTFIHLYGSNANDPYGMYITAASSGYAWNNNFEYNRNPKNGTMVAVSWNS